MSDRRVHTRWRKCVTLPRAIACERLEGRVLLSGAASAATAIPRGGVITTPFPNGPADAYTVAVQQDGKFVVAGSAKSDQYITPSAGNAVVVRYNPDGTLDGTFGTGGKAVLPAGPQGDDEIYATAIQGDGKIVVSGDHALVDGSDEYLNTLLLRLNPNGTEDQAFGANVAAGFASFGGSLYQLKGLVIQPDAKIVVAGSEATDSGKPPLVVVRFNADGTPDSQFGSGGIVRTSLNVSDVIADVTAMALQPDGKILVGGYTVPTPGEGIKFGILRLNADGSMDQGFGNGGRVATSFSDGNDYIQSLAIAPQGKIVATGWSLASAYSDDALARYNPDGSLDATFGLGGKLSFDIHFYDDLGGSAVESDGSIVAAGSSADSRGYQGMTVVRVRPNGSLDPAFGTGGRTITQIGKYSSRANAVALLPDGRIIAAGAFASPISGTGRDVTTNNQFAVGLFTADGKNDPTFGVPYDVNHDAAVDFADLLILGQHLGKAGTFAEGDLNGDGTIGMDDLLLLTQNYGNTSAVASGPPTATTVRRRR